MYDLLSVCPNALDRKFYVYLFREAIICVAEEKKRSLGRFLSSASGAVSSFTDGASVTSRATSQAKGVLQLKRSRVASISSTSLKPLNQGFQGKKGILRCFKQIFKAFDVLLMTTVTYILVRDMLL